MDSDMHGVRLIERVIEAVSSEGLGGGCGTPTLSTPTPLPAQVVADLRLPGGRPLPPSLQRWLCYDASWLAEAGWFADASAPDLEGRSLSAVVDWMYDFGRGEHVWTEMFAAFETLLPGSCFPLVGGTESRRLLYVGEPDSLGEYPVLVTDVDDLPYVGVMYPGFDVYLAHEEGVIDLDLGTYTELVEHPVYGARMMEHVAHTGLGEDGLEIQDL